jgi:hypothetical protein
MRGVKPMRAGSASSYDWRRQTLGAKGIDELAQLVCLSGDTLRPFSERHYLLQIAPIPLYSGET